MGLADDRVMQHHLAYFVGQAWVWIACVLVMGADLHQVDISGTTVKYFQDRAEVNGGATRYKDCSGSVCDKCASGGAGAVAMAVFCWLGATVVVVQRALFLAQKWQAVPWLGDNALRFGWIERGTNIWCCVTLFFSVIAWGAGCINEVAKTATVKPTAYVFVVMAVAVSGLCTALIWVIHIETDFMSGGGASGSAAPKASAAPATGASASAVDPGAVKVELNTDAPPAAAAPRAPPPRPPSHALNAGAADDQGVSA